MPTSISHAPNVLCEIIAHSSVSTCRLVLMIMVGKGKTIIIIQGRIQRGGLGGQNPPPPPSVSDYSTCSQQARSK